MSQTGSDSSSIRTSRTLTDAHRKQIEILQIMADHISQSQPKHFEINELSDLTTFKDEKEVLRYLLILEGQKLVSPHPHGDFTSSQWLITKEGARAVRTFTGSAIQ